MQLCTCQGMHAEVRGQFQGVGSLLPPCRIQECQASTPSPPPDESPCQPHCVWWDRFPHSPGAGQLDCLAQEPYRLPTLPPSAWVVSAPCIFKRDILEDWAQILMLWSQASYQLSYFLFSEQPSTRRQLWIWRLWGCQERRVVSIFFPFTLAFSNVHLRIYSLFPLEVQLQEKYFFGDQFYSNTTVCALQYYTPKNK